MRLFVLIGVFLIAGTSISAAVNHRDSTYIQSFDAISTGVYYSVRNHRISSPFQNYDFPWSIQSKEVVGVSIYPGTIGLRLGVQLPNETGEINDERNFALNLNVFGKRSFVELFYRDLYGFNGEPIGKTHLEGSVTFFTNAKKYSYRAAYAFTERQMKSAGSMSFQARLNRQSWYSDSTYLENNIDSSYYSYTSLSTGVGYAYSMIFLKNAYIDCGLNVGPEVQWLMYDDANQWTWMSDVRMALGFNHPLFYTGITGNFDFWNQPIESESVLHQFSNLSFHIGFRIN